MISVKQVIDDKEMDIAYEIRKEVFTGEQGVDEAVERDLYDEDALHVLASMNEVPVGTGRVILYENTAKMGRIAVLKAYRGHGMGQMICEELIDLARTQGANRMVLHAQVEAKNFYIKLGFAPVGLEFLEAQIKHIKMEKEIK